MRLEPAPMRPDTRRAGRAPGYAMLSTASRMTHDASNPGATGATIPAMKKLLLLVVIAALATLATKKVRAA